MNLSQHCRYGTKQASEALDCQEVMRGQYVKRLRGGYLEASEAEDQRAGIRCPYKRKLGTNKLYSMKYDLLLCCPDCILLLIFDLQDNRIDIQRLYALRNCPTENKTMTRIVSWLRPWDVILETRKSLQEAFASHRRGSRISVEHKDLQSRTRRI
jgi:hypothetical protein